MKQCFFLLVISFLVSAGGALGQPADTFPARSQITDCLRVAERSNPGLKAAYHRWQGALQKIPQAVSLEDPQLTFMEYLDRSMEPQEELGVMQMIPYPGKLELRGQAESAEASVRRKEFEKARLDLRAEVKDAFYEFYYLEQTVRINRENLELLRHFEQVAASLYAAGSGAGQDVLKAQVELGKIENEVRNLDDSRTPVRARLNAAMNRPSNAPLPTPQEADIRQVHLDTEAVLALAYRSNPELQAFDARIQKSRIEVALAHKEYYPDFTFGFNWMKGNESMEEPVPDDYVASVQMNLPIYRKRLEAGVREAEAGVREIENMKEEARNKLSVDLQNELYKLRNAERQMNLLSEILIPKARHTLENTETAYSAANANFLELVDTERELLMFQENYYRSIADYGQALAKIEAMAGRTLAEEGAPSILPPRISANPATLDAPIETEGSAPALAPQESESH